jgi:hypothetical protein
LEYVPDGEGAELVLLRDVVDIAGDEGKGPSCAAVVITSIGEDLLADFGRQEVDHGSRLVLVALGKERRHWLKV